jgi:hypothetical protein
VEIEVNEFNETRHRVAADNVHRPPGHQQMKVCAACKRAGKLKYFYAPNGTHKCKFGAVAADLEVKIINVEEIQRNLLKFKDKKNSPVGR